MKPTEWPGRALRSRRRGELPSELRTYPGVDHFDIYDGPVHDAVLADELAFLRRHLLGRCSDVTSIH